jgi:hypothetical protein
MSRTHPRRAAVAPFLVLLLFSVVPAVAGASPDVRVTTTSSPTSVTVGFAVAYPITVTNMSVNTLNHVTLDGATSVNLGYLGAEPVAACSQTVPTCDFGSLRGGGAMSATFYFRAPSTPGSFVFTATARVSEGASDNPGASHEDTFSTPITTNVLALNEDLVRGHSIPSDRTFSTGIESVTELNQHGTMVVMPANGEVTVRDLPPGAIPLACPALAATCFGWGSDLDIASGATFPQGIRVTVRWDVSDLPSGMNEKKLRVIHLLDGGGYELVTSQCTFSAGVPTNMPCLAGPPLRLRDKDLQATIYVSHNGVIRGW